MKGFRIGMWNRGERDEKDSRDYCQKRLERSER